MIYIFLLCFSVNLISANPLAKFLLQARKNNQNGFNNFNMPIPTNNVQPYAPPIMIQNPTANCPCNQPYMPQNGFPVQTNVEDVNQSYLNKLLANPKLQNILNPNTNYFNQNNKEFALQASPEQTPKIINNYYVIPPECLQGDEKGLEIIKNLIENHSITGQNEPLGNKKMPENERRMQRSQNQPNEEVSRPEGNKKAQNEESFTINNNNNRQRKRKKSGSQDHRHHHNKPNHNMNRSTSNKKRKNEKVNDERNLSHSQNNDKNHSPQSSDKNGKKKRKRPRNKPDDANDVSRVTNSAVVNNNDTVITELLSEQKPKEKRTETDVSRNNKDEDVIKDIHHKFPGIPENVIRRLLRYLRRQLQKQLMEIKCDQRADTRNNTRKHGNNRKSLNKHRKSKNNSTNIITVTENFSPDTTTFAPILITTTKEVITTQKENTAKYEDNTEKEHTTQYVIVTEVVETTTDTDAQTPKLGEEHKIEDLENNVDDYFPDFRFDKMYMSEDEYIRSLRDNKFYYTTDRNFEKKKESIKDESSEIYYKPFEPTKNVKKPKNNQFQSRETEDTLIRPVKDDFDENYGKTIIKDYPQEEIEFQTPPILEHPDFETKPIIKHFNTEHTIYTKQEYKNKENVSEKSSNYSDAKNVNTCLNKKVKNDNIETVYAGSKVVNYGKPQDFVEDIQDKEKQDDTVVVYARTMSDS